VQAVVLEFDRSLSVLDKGAAGLAMSKLVPQYE